MPTPRFRVQIAAFATGALSCAALPAFADGTPFFSTAQIGQGRYEYAQKCSVCHGTQSEGGGAPALQDLVGEHIDSMIVAAADSMEQIRARTVKPTPS